MIKSEYADNGWLERLVEDRPSPKADEHTSQKNSAPHSRQTCLADRYFTTRYFPDVCEKDAHDDLCVMQHSNRICIIGLAPGHAVFHTCTNNKTHTVIGVDFQLNSSFNLLQCKVSGRKKRGSHKLQQRNGNHCLGYAVCDRGERHALLSGGVLPGRLYESNFRLSIKAPDCDRISPAPIGHFGNNSAYLAIIMPPRVKAEISNFADGHSVSVLTTDGFITRGLTWDEYKALRGL